MARKRTKRPKHRSTVTPKTAGRTAGHPRGAEKVALTGSLRRREITPGSVERVALWLDRDVALQLRQRAAALGMSLSVAAESALRAWLETSGK
jgi:hypothetical protein